MLIEITQDSKGNITFDEDLVNSIFTLRLVNDKFGANGVAYVCYYCDLERPFYDIDDDSTKQSMVAEAASFNQKHVNDPIILAAIKEYAFMESSSPEGMYYMGYKNSLKKLGMYFKTKGIESKEDSQEHQAFQTKAIEALANKKRVAEMLAESREGTRKRWQIVGRGKDGKLSEAEQKFVPQEINNVLGNN